MVGDGSVFSLSTVGGLFTQRGFGGKSLGRGIRQARYIGRIKAIGQTELRWTMFGRPGKFQLGSHALLDVVGGVAAEGVGRPGGSGEGRQRQRGGEEEVQWTAHE